MQTGSQDIHEAVKMALGASVKPFWMSPAFWIEIAIGVAGLVFSVLAFIEARGAKRAATAAGRTVKIQTAAVDLTEIAQKLDRIQPEIGYNDAREMLNEISRRVRRVTSPFAKTKGLAEPITSLVEAINAAKQSLKSVRPSTPNAEAEVPQAVYLAVEGDFDTIGDYIADLLGKFDKETMDLGDDDGES